MKKAMIARRKLFKDYNNYNVEFLYKVLQEMKSSDVLKVPLLKTKEKIPLFRDVVKLVHDQVLLDIEIKNTDRIEEVCETLMKELKPYHNYIIKSFNPKIVRYIKKHYPDVEVGYLIDYRYHNKFFNWFLPSRLAIWYSKANFLAIHKRLLPTKKFQSLKNKYPLLLWTIKKEDTYDSDEYILICNDLIK